MKPSDFLTHPYDSVFQNNESEVVARNIMVILSRTGNVFRSMTWGEYRAERVKGRHFSEREKEFFDRVVLFCYTADTAACFSPTWRDAAQGESQ